MSEWDSKCLCCCFLHSLCNASQGRKKREPFKTLVKSQNNTCLAAFIPLVQNSLTVFKCCSPEFRNPFFQLINYGTKEESDMYLILQIYSKNAEPH